jgi:hypothetical protein
VAAPEFFGSCSIVQGKDFATAAVASTEPSSTTTTSKSEKAER